MLKVINSNKKNVSRWPEGYGVIKGNDPWFQPP